MLNEATGTYLRAKTGPDQLNALGQFGTVSLNIELNEGLNLDSQGRFGLTPQEAQELAVMLGVNLEVAAILAKTLQSVD